MILRHYLVADRRRQNALIGTGGSMLPHRKQDSFDTKMLVQCLLNLLILMKRIEIPGSIS